MMTTTINRQRRVLFPWRIACVIYAVALTIGTHWPRLQLGVGGEPAPSKIVHMLAFGGLTFLLWRTRWLGDGWLLLVVLLIWSMIDELTQGLPGLGRTVSWMDLASNWAGITIVFAWIRAIRPIGGPLNRMSRRLTDFVIDELFTKWRAWLLALLAGVGMGAVVGGVTTTILWFAHPDGILYAAFIAVPAGGLGGAFLLVDMLWRRERERVPAEMRCLDCGEPCADGDVDERGLGECSSCRRPFHFGQWQLHAALSRTSIVRLSVLPALLALGLCITAVLLYVGVIALYMRFPQELRPLHQFERLPIDFRLVVDMAILGVIAAVAMFRFRRSLARVVDQQAERCRHCGHDVHATETHRGIGRCPECGTMFIRLDEEAAYALSRPGRE